MSGLRLDCGCQSGSEVGKTKAVFNSEHKRRGGLEGSLCGACPFAGERSGSRSTALAWLRYQPKPWRDRANQAAVTILPNAWYLDSAPFPKFHKTLTDL